MTIVVVLLSSNYSNSGALAYAMAIGNLFYPIATYNMRTIQASDVAGENSASEYSGFRVVTIMLAVVLVVSYLLLTTSSLALIVTACCWLLFKADESFCAVFYAVDQKAMRLDYVGISQGVRGVLSVALFSVILFVAKDLNIAILFVSLACVGVTIFYDFRKASLFENVKPKIDLRSVLALLRRYLPSVLLLLFYGAVVSVARQNLEYQQGAEMLGVYAAVATPTVLVQVAASYLYAPIIPVVSKQWLDNDLKGFVLNLLKVICSIVLVFAVVLCGAFFYGEQLLVAIFGGSIAEHAYLLIPALFATLITALMAFLFDMLVIMRHLKEALASNAIALIIAVAGSSGAIALFGANGVNVIVMIAFAVGAAVSAVSIFRSVWLRRSALAKKDG